MAVQLTLPIVHSPWFTGGTIDKGIHSWEGRIYVMCPTELCIFLLKHALIIQLCIKYHGLHYGNPTIARLTARKSLDLLIVLFF